MQPYKIRRTVVAALAMAATFAAVACSGDEVAPQVTVGPEALTVQLSVSPTAVVTGQAVTLRATIRNQGDALVLARYGTSACGPEIIVQKAGGEPYFSGIKPCAPPASDAGETLAPGQGYDYTLLLPNMPAGTYQAWARFNAANGQAPNSAPATFVVQP